jgi:hypothetical protein
MTKALSPSAALIALAEAEGLTLATTFVPFSQSRNAEPGADGKIWKSLNWRITLFKNGREIITTDYAQGEGHCPAAKVNIEAAARIFSRRPVDARRILIDHEIETGRVAKPKTYAVVSGAAITPPSMDDVLGSLASDADAINYADFDQWAAEYGYDPDSRAAFRTYKACLDIGLKLRAALGESVFSRVRELAAEL